MSADFTPIEGDSSYSHRNRDSSVRSLREDDKRDITDLLMGHKVTKVDGEHLLLDNGTVIKAIGNEGGCSCGAGDYDLAVLNGVDNIITKVEFDYAPAGDGYDPEPDFDAEEEWAPAPEGYYRIFVFTDNQRVNLMQVDGSDGNGYYGTGFEILVRDAQVSA
jgi:hypothetical protein